MDLDLTFGQLRLVYLLSQQGPQSIGHIAERFGVTMTAASQFADRIERQGLAERHHRSDDRRVVELRLTEAGSALVAGMLGMQRDVLRDLFSVFTPAELEQLERLVRTMVERHGTRSSSRRRPSPIDQPPDPRPDDLQRQRPQADQGVPVYRLTQLALARKSVTLLLAAGVFVAGILAWGQLQAELLPDIDFPVATVIAVYPGAGTTDVAEQVSAPIERTLSSVQGVKSVRSTSSPSLAVVIAEFEYGTDIKAAVADIESNLTSAGLPPSVEPQVSTLNINAFPITSLTVQSDDASVDVGKLVRDRGRAGARRLAGRRLGQRDRR